MSGVSTTVYQRQGSVARHTPQHNGGEQFHGWHRRAFVILPICVGILGWIAVWLGRRYIR
jgi:hypothetical protein